MLSNQFQTIVTNVLYYMFSCTVPILEIFLYFCNKMYFLPFYILGVSGAEPSLFGHKSSMTGL